ncbi:MAG: hypothetical protein AABN95_09410 [Acidobacteriota bacterium]
MTPKPKKGMVRRGTWEITKKLLKAIPIIGPVFTIGFAGNDIKKKGLVAGAVHVGLDVTPVVGTAKSLLEIFTGDLIPDKTPNRSRAAQVAEQPSPHQGEIAHTNTGPTE